VMAAGFINWAVIITAAVSVGWSGLSCYFVINSFARYRTTDLLTAATTPDLSTLGTCAGRPSSAAVEMTGWSKTDWTCDEASVKSVSKTLVTNAHGLVWLLANGTGSQYEDVVKSAVTAALGGDTGTQVNASLVAGALDLLENQPTDCALLYPGATMDPAAASSVQVLPTISCTETVAGTDIDSAANTNKLYTMCMRQFQYLRSGTDGESLGRVPMLGADPGPVWTIPWTIPEGYNDTMSWSQKGRLFVGYRFGWSVWAYVPLMLASSFLAIDALIYLVVAATRPERFEGIATTADGSSEETAAQFLAIRATTKIKRRLRLTIGIALVLVSALATLLFVWIPFEFGQRMPRPICEKGGWRSDSADAFIFEALVLAGQVVVVIGMPLVFVLTENSSNGGSYETTTPTREGQADALKDSRRTGFYLVIIAIGSFVVLFGQIWVAAGFGSAWALSIVDPNRPWDLVTVTDIVYDDTLGNFAIAAAIGGVLASTVGRWLLPGQTCEGFLVWLIWLAISLGAYIPLVAQFGVLTFTSVDDATNNCQLFPEETFNFQHESCEVRKYTFIGGISAISVPIVIMTVYGFRRYGGSILKARNKASVARLRQATVALFQRRTVGPGDVARGGFGAGYRSSDTPFFNFSGNNAPDSMSDDDTAAGQNGNAFLRITPEQLAAVQSLPAMHLKMNV